MPSTSKVSPFGLRYTVFGKANTLEKATSQAVVAPADVDGLLTEMGLHDGQQNAIGANVSSAAARTNLRQAAASMRTLAVYEVLVFFVILLIGFAYVWSMGDLDWVRTMTRGARQTQATGIGADVSHRDAVLSA